MRPKAGSDATFGDRLRFGVCRREPPGSAFTGERDCLAAMKPDSAVARRLLLWDRVTKQYFRTLLCWKPLDAIHVCVLLLCLAYVPVPCVVQY
jgi:hypothetical protein